MVLRRDPIKALQLGFLALLVIFMNYLADILYALLNPRIRYE